MFNRGKFYRRTFLLDGDTMKKVVILNASPRKDGNISQMLNIIGDTLFEKGTEAEESHQVTS